MQKLLFNFCPLTLKCERIMRIEKSLFFNISECAIYLMVFAVILKFGIQGMECLGIGIRKCVEFCVQFRLQTVTELPSRTQQ